MRIFFASKKFYCSTIIQKQGYVKQCTDVISWAWIHFKSAFINMRNFLLQKNSIVQLLFKNKGTYFRPVIKQLWFWSQHLKCQSKHN